MQKDKAQQNKREHHRKQNNKLPTILQAGTLQKAKQQTTNNKPSGDITERKTTNNKHNELKVHHTYQNTKPPTINQVGT